MSVAAHHAQGVKDSCRLRLVEVTQGVRTRCCRYPFNGGELGLRPGQEYGKPAGQQDGAAFNQTVSGQLVNQAGQRNRSIPANPPDQPGERLIARDINDRFAPASGAAFQALLKRPAHPTTSKNLRLSWQWSWLE